MLRIVVFCLGLMIALPAAAADAYEDCVQKQDRDRTIRGCTEIIKLDPKFAFAYYNRGRALEAKGNHDRAIADYNKAIKLDPKNAPAKEGLKRLRASH
jgi:tetratricopeptide (TPR) repeat protein